MTTEQTEPPSTGKPKVCPECQGRGWKDNLCTTDAQARRCSFCDGRGADLHGKECYACHGTGLMEVRQEDKAPCALCGGAGLYPVPESLTINEFAFNPANPHSVRVRKT
jgi:DnaJ-class molecular chaperone